MPKKAKNTKRDGVYTRKDRPGYWISWVDAQGRRRFRKTDAQTAHQAKAARAAELVRVEQAKVIGFTPPGEEPFEDVAARFLAHQKVRLTTRAFEREQSIIDIHLKSFFSCKLAAIRRVDVQRYVTKRSGEASAHSVQKELNVLKHLLNLSVEWEMIPFNPAQGVKSPRVPAGRVRYLQPTELRTLIEACPEWLRPIVALAVSTGMPRGEILGLRWLDVDMMSNRILLPQTKNGDGRIVYLNQSAQAVLRSLTFGTPE
jgi:integrase